MNKSYWEIVKTCKLLAYREEFAAKGSVWKEYWQDVDRKYTALFSNQDNTYLPLTIYTQYE